MITRTVTDMYKVSNRDGLKLLSEYPAEFWKNYIQNSARYDKLFNRLYRSFRYFMQEDDESNEVVTNNFIEDVYNHLLINDKKYSELYRVQVIDDERYSILGNYDITETLDKNTTGDSTLKTGSRTDKTTDNMSKSEQVNKTQTDYTQGSQSNTTTKGIEGFNSTDFSNSDKFQDSIGQRSDKNTENETIGTRTDTNTRDFVSGEQTDVNSSKGTEAYTLTRKGNIGTETGADIIRKHTDYWSYFEFYSYIFREIAKELLLA